MENEIVHIAKFIAWPTMREFYGEFGQHVAKACTLPELQLCQIAMNNGEVPVDPGPALDWLTEETLRLSRGKIRGPHGKIETTASSLSRTLIKLRETVERLEFYKQEVRLESEKSFREWLERSIVSNSANEEPTIGMGEDPIQKAIRTVEQLHATKMAFENRGSGLSFPMSNFKLTIKPKTPTAMEPFDNGELEGGAEEDTCMILAGESNIGKSHLGLFCLSSLSMRREATLLCSGEDSEETTKRRIFAHFLRKTDRELILMSDLERETEFTNIYGDKEDTESFHHHIANNFAMACIEEGKFYPQSIVEKIDAFEQAKQRKVKAVMADYLQKMNENPAGKSNRRQRDEELEFTVNQIKDLCQNNKVLTIIISQVPSHAAGGAHEFLNLKQAVARSYAATWGAHYVVTMNRTQEETTRLANSLDKRPRLNLFLCKNKNGGLGMCYALGYPDQARWEFYRTKAEMIAKIDADAVQGARAELDPTQYSSRAGRNLH